MLSILDAFPNIPRIKVDKDTAFKISNGVALNKFFDGDLAFILDNNDNLLALYKNIDNMSRAYKMFI